MTALQVPHLVRAPVTPPPPGTRPPVLLLLHGLGSTEHPMFALRHHVGAGCVVVSVQGPVSVAGEPDRFRSGVRFGRHARGWFHTHEDPAAPGGRRADAAELDAAVARVLEAARDAPAAFGGDPARVFAAGFSQGAMTALAALLAHPEALAGAAALGGRLLPEVVPRIATPERLAGRAVLVAHGTGDPRVPVDEARRARDVLSALPLALTYHEVEARTHAVTAALRDRLAAWVDAVAGGA